MMNKLEEAIIYATVMHQGKVRKFGNIPYILHPLEVAQIISTMTDDEDVIAAGILHDIVEDTDGTLSEIEKRFGKRVAEIVNSESENKYPEEDPSTTWKRRKEESLLVLRNSTDIGVKMLWLADKLANIRSLAGIYSERGEAMWQVLHQSDPTQHQWYYRSVAENVELSLNKTGAFKELIKHINFIWPGTFDREKTRYRKYKEVSVEGCKMIGWGAKGEVYRYDDELVIKVFNQNNTYHDVEEEIAKSRRAFVLGVPTAISFGIVSVGDRYGAMYELLEAETVSSMIAKNPSRVEVYAGIMAKLCLIIHGIRVKPEDNFPCVSVRLKKYISDGIAKAEPALTDRCVELIDTLSEDRHLLHGDFHTGNVFLQNGEPLLIDMDRLSYGHPVAELADLYYCYVILGEDDPSVIENYMRFSYETSKRFFEEFLRRYFNTDDDTKLKSIMEKLSFLSSLRAINRIRRQEKLSVKDQEWIERYTERVRNLAEKIETLVLD